MLKTVIPSGPQHPVLPEPLHLKLTVEDEIIVEAIPAFGFIHRGLEALAGLRDFHQRVQVVERVCGICTEACPAKCLHQKKEYRVPVYKRESIRMQGGAKQKKEST